LALIFVIRHWDRSYSERPIPGRRPTPRQPGWSGRTGIGHAALSQRQPPVYRAGRRANLIGFTGTEILPNTILTTALLGHPGIAVAFRYEEVEPTRRSWPDVALRKRFRRR